MAVLSLWYRVSISPGRVPMKNRPNFPPKIKIPKNGRHPQIEPAPHIWESSNKKSIRIIANPSSVRKD